MIFREEDVGGQHRCVVVNLCSNNNDDDDDKSQFVIHPGRMSTKNWQK